MARLLTALVLLSAFTASAVGFRADARPLDRLERPSGPTYRPTWVRKNPGHYSRIDWERAIDSVWGPGMPAADKLEFLDDWWDAISADFACFNNLPLTWDSLNALVAHYRAEVEDTVSRGRFAGIMSHLAMQLMEAHTWADDRDVCINTELLPGVPLQVMGGWYWDQHFGAGLTVLEDSTLVVYSVEDSPAHPFGLRPGDIILGYDGRPWAELNRELRAAQLPVHACWTWGSRSESMTYSMLISAGLNWHLFDTIDIKKWPSDSVVHLPTSLMVGYEPYIVHSEQMDIPGVSKPDLDSLQSATYGVMEHGDSAIGYIYSWTWTWTSSTEFRRACSALVAIDSLQGIIVDYRFNVGGYFGNCHVGYQKLFRDTCDILDACDRESPTDPYAMVPIQHRWIAGNGIGYAKPVAVLLGPGCVSAGDYAAYAATLLHAGPARTFGRPTNGAHIAGRRTLNINPDWSVSYANYETRKCDDPTYYMTHRGFDPDTAVWHTRDAIAQGRDAVVEAAAEWIASPGGIAESGGTRIASKQPTILTAPALARLDCRVLDALGRDVTDRKRDLSPGIYFVEREETDRTTKVVVLK